MIVRRIITVMAQLVLESVTKTGMVHIVQDIVKQGMIQPDITTVITLV